MDKEYSIRRVEEPDDTMWGVIGGGIRDFNIQQTGDNQYKRVCFILYTPEEEVAGGLIGELYWNWLHIDLLFVKEELRGRGFASRIMAMAEEEARGQGAKNAFLDTFSFQALDFYKKYGYQVFGELKDFPPGHQRYYLMKPLDSDE